MKAFPIIVIVSAFIVGVGVYMYASGSTAAADVATPEPMQANTRIGANLETAAAAPARPPQAAAPGVTPSSLERLAADVASNDAYKRAEAIGALASAPVADALPILKTVVSSGESTIDRPLALRSLRDIAVREGDANGAIRDVVRQSIYHAKSDELSRQAQAALDDIEVLLAAQ